MPRYILNLAPFPKPRGQLGKHGNITHSADPRYRTWQLAFKQRLAAQTLDNFDFAYGYGFIFSMPKKAGQQPDVDNLMGGIMDCLTPHWLKDDNWRILNRCYIVAIPAIVTAQIGLIICESRAEYHSNFLQDN
jgi:Holliday junction resolvase RusA-like endonuclease